MNAQPNSWALKLNPWSEQSNLFIFAICASFLLSTWIDSNTYIVNPDAICYLASSEQIGRIGLRQAMHFCGQAGWPFFSLLIFATVKITHLSYPNAAYVLNAICTSISVAMFMLIVRELGATKRTILYAAVCILLAHEFNSVREYIVRDHGFWAFYLTSIWLLLKYVHTPSLRYGLYWSASMLLATLFRVEGGIFLIALPWLMFFVKAESFTKKIIHFLQLNILTFCILICGCAYLFLVGTTSQLYVRLIELPQLQHSFANIIAHYQATKTALSTHVLNGDSAKEASVVFFAMMIAWYLASVILNLTPVYTLLFIYAWLKKAVRLPKNLALVLFAYLSVNVIITATFLFERMFLSKRYLIALSLVLMLWVPFGFAEFVRNHMHKRFVLIALTLLILISSLSGIFNFGYSKKHIYQGAIWAQHHIPKDAKLYTNDYQLMYYSDHFGDDIFKLLRGYMSPDRISKGKWHEFDYLLMRFDIKNKTAMAMLDEINIAPIKTFRNKRGDSVMIFKVNQHNSEMMMRSKP